MDCGIIRPKLLKHSQTIYHTQVATLLLNLVRKYYIQQQGHNRRAHTHTHKIGSHFAIVCFTTIHIYARCPFGPSTPYLRCITVATQTFFLYLVWFWLFSNVHVFLLLLF